MCSVVSGLHGCRTWVIIRPVTIPVLFPLSVQVQVQVQVQFPIQDLALVSVGVKSPQLDDAA